MEPNKHFSFDPASFTQEQREVMVLLAEGATVTSAAKIRGIHRTTIQTWMRKTPGFRSAVLSAREEACARRREQFTDSNQSAIDYLQKTVNDEAASHSVRTRIAFGLLKLKVQNGGMLETLLYGYSNSMSMPEDIHRIKDAQVRSHLECTLAESLSRRNQRAHDFEFPPYEPAGETAPASSHSSLSSLSSPEANSQLLMNNGRRTEN